MNKCILVLIFILSSIVSYGQLKAFPSAEGSGKYAVGGSGGSIIHVTTLADSGAGSLRAALTTTGVRTVVFDVGGIITLLSPIEVGNTSSATGDYAYVTIAGETAPFPGITINNDEIYFQAGDVIMRYITMRSTSDGGAVNANSPNCIKHRNWGTGGYIMEDMIYDHLTLSHSGNENFGVYADQEIAPLRNVTVQNCMIGILDTGDGNILIGPNTHNITMYQNYIHHTERRNPLIGYGYNNVNEKKEFINNIVYGGLAASGASYGNIVDFVSNIYKSTDNMPNKFSAYGWGDAGYVAPEDAVEGDGLVHYDGNYPSGPFTFDSNFVYYSAKLVQYNEPSRVFTGSMLTTFNTLQPDIENAVLPTVGNSLFRETFDQNLIDDYYAGTGDYTTLTKPTKSSTTRSASDDSDSDDMLDVAEIALWGSITVTNTPLGTTSTSVLDNNGNSINGYDNIRKTHFYLAGDLGGVVAPPALNSKLINRAKKFF